MKLLPLVALGLSMATAACSSSSARCNCPLGSSSVAISLPCGVTTPPTMNLSGVCAGEGGLIFGATSAGVCHVKLVYADGSQFATDVTFQDVSVSGACNCGPDLQPVDLPLVDGVPTVMAGVCDGGVD